jgi:Dna[CI] antecedent DciA-like protein
MTRLGDLGPASLGLPERLERELLLHEAWNDVAGDALAIWVTAVEVRRGILEVSAPDERWVEVLAEVLPRLTGRLAARYPSLGVRRFRVRCGKVEGLLADVTPENPPDSSAGRDVVRTRSDDGAREPEIVRDPERWLAAVAERYLARGSG